jgi:hypothetical protein
VRGIWKKPPELLRGGFAVLVRGEIAPIITMLRRA